MKNVTNTYGYYLTEDSETIEYTGNFEQNSMLFTTKNPDEQLNYKVFTSPTKAINFAIKIVGGTNPEVVYIPQHIYKDLQIAYNEDNPYYTIKDVTVIKLDFTDTGNSLIKYLKTKFETTTEGTSKLSTSGVDTIVNYAGFDKSGNPSDEDILKQILFLFDEQNDVIFVNKDDVLVTEQTVNSKSLKSNRIKGDFNYTSNYFDGNGVFSSELLNSETNIKLESSTFTSVLQLSDFIKDFSGKSLSAANDLYKNNIVTDTLIAQAPKVAGLVLGGLQKAVPLVKGLKDKISQRNAQRGVKQLEEAKSLGLSSSNDISGTTNSVKDIMKTPVVPQLSNKVPNKVTVKPVSNEYKSAVKELTERKVQEKAARLAGLESSGDYDEDTFGNRVYDDPTENTAYQDALIRVRKKEAEDGALGSMYGISSAAPMTNSIKTISTIGNVSQAEGQEMIKNAKTSTPSSIKQINADFLKF